MKCSYKGKLPPLPPLGARIREEQRGQRRRREQGGRGRGRCRGGRPSDGGEGRPPLGRDNGSEHFSSSHVQCRRLCLFSLSVCYPPLSFGWFVDLLDCWAVLALYWRLHPSSHGSFLLSRGPLFLIQGADHRDSWLFVCASPLELYLSFPQLFYHTSSNFCRPYPHTSAIPVA